MKECENISNEYSFISSPFCRFLENGEASSLSIGLKIFRQQENWTDYIDQTECKKKTVS